MLMSYDDFGALAAHIHFNFTSKLLALGQIRETLAQAFGQPNVNALKNRCPINIELNAFKVFPILLFKRFGVQCKPFKVYTLPLPRGGIPSSEESAVLSREAYHDWIATIPDDIQWLNDIVTLISDMLESDEVSFAEDINCFPLLAANGEGGWMVPETRPVGCFLALLLAVTQTGVDDVDAVKTFANNYDNYVGVSGDTHPAGKILDDMYQIAIQIYSGQFNVEWFAEHGYIAADSLSSKLAPYSDLLEYNMRLFVDAVELDFESLIDDKLPLESITENTSIVRLMLMVSETNILACMKLPEKHNLHYRHRMLKIEIDLSRYFYAKQYLAFLQALEKIDLNLSLTQGDTDKVWYTIEKKYDFTNALVSKISDLLTKLDTLPSEATVGDIFPNLRALQKKDKKLKESNTVNRLIDSKDIRCDATKYEDTEFFVVRDESTVFKTGKLNMVTPSDIELMTVYRAFGVDFLNVEESRSALETHTVFCMDHEIHHVEFDFERAIAAFDVFYIPAYGKLQLDDAVIRSEYYDRDDDYPFIPTETLFRCGIKNDVGKSIFFFERAIFSKHSKESIGEQLYNFITALSRHIDGIERKNTEDAGGKIIVLGSSCRVFKISLQKNFPNDEFLFYDDRLLFL